MGFIVWDINPRIFTINGWGPVWYGLLFASGFLIGQQILFYIFRKDKRPERDVEVITVYVLIATVLGARLGHVLFYQPDYYFSHPLDILKIWEGGLASHGATVTILLALLSYTNYPVIFGSKFPFVKIIKRQRPGQSFLWLVDRIVITVALGGALIRIGNLMNSEIYGKPTDVPWAFIYAFPEGTHERVKENLSELVDEIAAKKIPGDTILTDTLNRRQIHQKVQFEFTFKKGKITEPEAYAYASQTLPRQLMQYEAIRENIVFLPGQIQPAVRQDKGRYVATFQAFGKPRHPTQIYEAAFCIFLLILTFWMWRYKSHVLPEGVITATFIILLFVFRFLVEFIKKEQVDIEKGMDFNIGQQLSIPAVLFGIGILLYAYWKKKKPVKV
jgi:phosphatidylglycerol---prolipoprotein diacylglyceryl transferase